MSYEKLFRLKKLFIINYSLLIILASCSVSKQISKSANHLLKDSSLINAHVGISIFDPSTGKYLYNYQGDKYFVPASNTKLFTLYAGMKYLGDSLVGLKYFDLDTAILIIPTGDPSFLHSDFKIQPVLNFLKKAKKPLYISTNGWIENALGYGWAWDDYNGEYMVERNPFPVHGNVVRFNIPESNVSSTFGIMAIDWSIVPSLFQKNTERVYSQDPSTKSFFLQRKKDENTFQLISSKSKFTKQEIPFVTDTLNTTLKILWSEDSIFFNKNFNVPTGNFNLKNIHSQPTDSLFKPMMHRSDNFFAEQTLLMVSNEKLGYMNDEAIIDTLLKTDLKDAPQKPKWVDGSGLSRYNLFTPQDFIFILKKMKDEFGLARMKNILATGGTGTISNYYQNLWRETSLQKPERLVIIAHLSGYLITKKGKLLLFSVLANNYQDWCYSP